MVLKAKFGRARSRVVRVDIVVEDVSDSELAYRENDAVFVHSAGELVLRRFEQLAT